MRMLWQTGWSAAICAVAISLTTGVAQTVPSIDGIWLGTLTIGGQTLRAQVKLAKGGTSCVFDSVDQKSFGIPCGNVVVKGDAVAFDVPAVNGKWVGTISADGGTLTGTFSQGAPVGLPLVMTRQATAIAGPKVEPPAYDAAMPPVGIDEIKAVIDRELAADLASGQLAPEKHGGVTIGVIEHGKRLIWSYGLGKDDSVYEIGSISKTFTATILAKMVEQKQVRLDEPVRELLPPETVAKPDGAEITLLDLSDQHSGLPRMPNNFAPKDPANPYADYDAARLYAFMAKQGVALPAHAPFGYSNLGVGLLGQALSNRAGVAYPVLLEREVTGPLGMKSTGVALTESMKARFIQGYDSEYKPAHAWDLVALAGAGAIRSDAADMLAYLEAQLHPEKLADKQLAAAIEATHVVRADVGGGMHIGLNWFRYDETGSYWHNGGTGGFSSYALFNPEKDFAVVVLWNRTPGEGSITDALGMHVAQRLGGLKAVKLQ
jgi:D-alanyl-D-alanine-carboxypeptidase/D-alanyl-D-alanine-endopeptidase